MRYTKNNQKNVYHKIANNMTGSDETKAKLKELASDFSRAIEYLEAGFLAINKEISQDAYSGIRRFISGLLGAPSSAISGGHISREIASKTYILDGALKANQEAEDIFRKITTDYSAIYNQTFTHFKNFIKEILEAVGEDASISEEEDEKIFKLKMKFLNSDSKSGLFSKNSPRYIILNELSPYITYLYSEIKKTYYNNKNIVAQIKPELDSGKLSAESKAWLKNIFSLIQSFKILLNNFTVASEYRSAVRKQKTLSEGGRAPRSRGTGPSSSTSSGKSPSSIKLSDIVARGLSVNYQKTSIENEPSRPDLFTIKHNSQNRYLIPILIGKDATTPLTKEEVDKLKRMPPQDIIISLLKNNSLNMLDELFNNLSVLLEGGGITYSNGESYLVLLFSNDLKLLFPLGKILLSIGDQTTGSSILKFANQLQNLKIQKYSDYATTPFYKTISPSGKEIEFTPADLVMGGGKLKDKDGKSFKPKKIKGKSLADKVMSKNFGRTK
jgi:hypothetical protein